MKNQFNDSHNKKIYLNSLGVINGDAELKLLLETWKFHDHQCNPSCFGLPNKSMKDAP